MFADVDLLSGINAAVAQVPHVPVVWKLTAVDQETLRVNNVSIASNAHVIEFAPQNDLLGHPSTRAFVTQGGSNSFYEV